MLFSQEMILFHIFNSELCCLPQGTDVIYAFLFFLSRYHLIVAWKTSKFILNGIEEKLIILCSLYKGSVGFLFKNKILNAMSYTVKQEIFIIAYVVIDRERRGFF